MNPGPDTLPVDDDEADAMEAEVMALLMAGDEMAVLEMVAPDIAALLAYDDPEGMCG